MAKAAIAASAMAIVLTLAPVARAMERITLSNGFDVECDHHQLVDGRVRIYPKPATPDYFELKPEDIQTVELLPDPPKEPVAKVSKTTVKARAAEPTLTASDLRQLLTAAGAEHNLDADLLASVVKAESGGNSRARSRAGAQGLMQLMPGTAHELGVADSYAPDQNVRGGTTYLDALLTRYHDNIVLALAAYNAGPQAVDRYHGVPPFRETRLYVARVIHEFNRRVAARRSVPASVALNASGHERLGSE